MLFRLLDIFFLIFHTGFTVFNVVGWMFRKTRKIHCITMTLTAFSWFVIGIWYGWGYCFCTDWHWQIREALGKPIPYYSYIQFLIAELTGYVPNAEVTNFVVGLVFILCFVLTIYYNRIDFKKKHITR